MNLKNEFSHICMYNCIFIYIQVYIHEVTHLFTQSIASNVCFDLNLQSQCHVFLFQ